MTTLGIIGGSGLYDLPGLENVRREKLTTPWGEPSDEFVVGELGGTELVFLPRHGVGHRISPSRVNSRANIHGMKQLGVTHLISVTAVGSMKEEIVPGHLVLVDQFIDRTHQRATTFFDSEGLVAHVAFAEPVCARFKKHLEAAAFAANVKAHSGGAYLCIEGPQFSTRAESLLYRQWNVDVIGMTAAPEAKLAREAEMCFSAIALATDYDCWRDGHEAVTVADVVATMQKNVGSAREVIRAVALAGARLDERSCSCGHALDHAVMTAPAKISDAARKQAALLLGDRYPA